jgi:hypothetical protein
MDDFIDVKIPKMSIFVDKKFPKCPDSFTQNRQKNLCNGRNGKMGKGLISNTI